MTAELHCEVVVAGAAHLVSMARPAELNALVLVLLRQHGA
jgi:hypothetical protein